MAEHDGVVALIEDLEKQSAAQQIPQAPVEASNPAVVSPSATLSSAPSRDDEPRVVADSAPPPSAVVEAPDPLVQTQTLRSAEAVLATVTAGNGFAPPQASAVQASALAGPTEAMLAPQQPATGLMALPVTAMSVASSLLAAVLSPFFVSTTAPTAPAQSPVLWTVLAWVRRTFFNQTPTIGYDPAGNSQDAGGIVTGDLGAVDPDGDPLNITVTQAPGNGTVLINPDGTFAYTPDAELATIGGTDEFTVKVTDKGFHLHGLLFFLKPDWGHSTTATIGVTVTPVNNNAPTVTVGDGVTDTDTGVITYTIETADADDDPVIVVVDGPPDHGSLSTNPDGTLFIDSDDGTFTYTPDFDYAHAVAARGPDTDTFTLAAIDGRGGITKAPSVDVRVIPINTEPTLSVSDGVTNRDTGAITYTIETADADLDTVRVVVFDAPDHGTLSTDPDGTLTISQTGTFTYTPDFDYAHELDPGDLGHDTFILAAIDGHGGRFEAPRVDADVIPINTEPTLTVIADVPDPDTGEIAYRIRTVDADGDTVTVELTYAGDGELISVLGGIGALYTPTQAARLNAALSPVLDTDVLTVAISDGHGAAIEVTVPLAISPARFIVTDIDVGGRPFGVAFSPDGTRAYVTEEKGDTVSVIDIAANAVTDTITVGDAPLGVAVSRDGTVAYVANSDDDTVSVIDTDPTSLGYHTVIGTIGVGGAPVGVAVSRDGTVAYVANSDDDTVSVIDTDPTSLGYHTVIGTIDVSDAPVGVAVSPDGTLAYVTNQGGGAVSVIDTATNTLVDLDPTTMGNDPIVVGGAPVGVAFSPDGTLAYITNLTGGTVSVIDTATGAVITAISVGDALVGAAVSPDGTRIYVTDYDRATVSVIQLTAALIIPVGDRPVSVAVSPDGALAYVANSDDGTVSVINTATAIVSDTVDVGGRPRGVAFSLDGTRAYIPNGDTVSVIDTVTGMVTDIPVGGGPVGVAVSRDGTVAYVANSDGTVSVIDTGTDTVTDSIIVGGTLDAVAVSPDGALVYVTNSKAGIVSVIDTGTGTVRDVTVGGIPSDVAFSLDGRRAYVTNGNSVLVIDTATGMVTDIPVDGGPVAVAVSPDGTHAYVSNADGTVSMLDIATGIVTNSFDVGENPVDLAVSPDGTRIYVTNWESGTVRVVYFSAQTLPDV